MFAQNVKVILRRAITQFTYGAKSHGTALVAATMERGGTEKQGGSMARRCKHSQCKAELPPASKCTDYMQKRGFCNVECATQCGLERAGKAKERKQKQELRQAKERVKARPELAREAQTAINAYVRLRDMGKPCISCDRPDDGTHQRHASHYRSVGACSSLRFNLKNIYASCQQCNTSKSGNIIVSGS